MEKTTSFALKTLLLSFIFFMVLVILSGLLIGGVDAIGPVWWIWIFIAQALSYFLVASFFLQRTKFAKKGDRNKAVSNVFWLFLFLHFFFLLLTTPDRIRTYGILSAMMGVVNIGAVYLGLHFAKTQTAKTKKKK